MWSPSFVPKPKDWPSHVDVVGTFFDAAAPKPSEAPSLNLKSPQAPSGTAAVPGCCSLSGGGAPRNQEGSQSKSKSQSHLAAGGASSSPTLSSSQKGAAAGTGTATGTGAAPSKTIIEKSFVPPVALEAFLAAGDRPVFVGFGSMVIKDMEALVSLFLDGAAVAGVRIIVQLGWTSISPDRFRELALQAQVKAALLRSVDSLGGEDDDPMGHSGIFPSVAVIATANLVAATATTAAASASVGEKGQEKGAEEEEEEEGAEPGLFSLPMRSVESSGTLFDAGADDEEGEGQGPGATAGAPGDAAGLDLLGDSAECECECEGEGEVIVKGGNSPAPPGAGDRARVTAAAVKERGTRGGGAVHGDGGEEGESGLNGSVVYSAKIHTASADASMRIRSDSGEEVPDAQQCRSADTFDSSPICSPAASTLGPYMGQSSSAGVSASSSVTTSSSNKNNDAKNKLAGSGVGIGQWWYGAATNVSKLLQTSQQVCAEIYVQCCVFV
jgi:hypothetical protein